ncbi:MAG TPA: SH3 domain-containing protein [Pyrinomonadaceae bacterium]|jgi:hypothetical protein|nr:SH3 domain-containing protein [Pyrinomonadaceae bacterium]
MMRVFFLGLALTLLTSIALGQETTIKPRRYETIDEVRLLSEPNPDSTQVGKIPSGKTLEALEKKSYWIRIKYKGKEGWATTAAMTQIMDVPAPDLEFHSNGYKIISNRYRYFFGINNAGVASYTNKLTLRLFDADGEKILEEEYTFANSPIVASGGRSFYVDTDAQAVKFEFEHQDGKVSGEIGKFIERLE